MSGIILYKSKYGAIKKYTEWLVEDTGFACVETEKADIKQVKKYDVIVLGGGIYASGIAGLSFLKKHIDELKGKKIVVFCAGASPYEESAFQAIVEYNMKDKLKNIPCYYCRGAWNMNIMSFKDKTLCKMLRKAVAKKDPSTYEPWMTALMAAGDDVCDWTDREYLKPLLEEIY